MFLMFQLRRLDVWPVDDYGVRKGWALAHKLKEPPTPKALQAEGEQVPAVPVDRRAGTAGERSTPVALQQRLR